MGKTRRGGLLEQKDVTRNKIQLPPFMTHTLDEVQEILFCSIIIIIRH